MLALILYLTFFDNKRVFKLFLSLFCSLYFGFKLNLFCSSEKCPQCYGDELCRFFQNHQIQLTWYSYFLSLINPKWTKSVFYGFFNDSSVVIKRKVRSVLENDILGGVDLNGNEVRRIVLCPSVVNRSFLFNQVKEGIEGKRLWLDINTSIEPLLLLYFQFQSIQVLPKYLGACGDTIVEEYKGKPLNNFLSSDFGTRGDLAIHLLEMANLFTFGDSDLAFYFTDYSLDNLVVDLNGGVFLVDLDSVIISNKSAVKENHFKGNIHRSEILDEYKYAFSPFDICSHHISDHNYFSICKYLLSHPEDGLLREIPSGIPRKEELLHLLNECTLPEEAGDRFSAGQHLQSLLQEIIHDKT